MRAHCSAGDDRRDSRRAKLGRLFEHEVEAVLFEQGGAQPQIGYRLAPANVFDHVQRHSAFRHVGHVRGPFSGCIVA